MGNTLLRNQIVQLMGNLILSQQMHIKVFFRLEEMIWSRCFIWLFMFVKGFYHGKIKSL